MNSAAHYCENAGTRAKTLKSLGEKDCLELTFLPGNPNRTGQY